MRTAILRGIRPTSLLLRKQPLGKWNELDFLLMEAYQILDDETSGSSGHPIWLTRNINPDLTWVIEERTDLADAAIQDYDEKRNEKKNPPKGVARFAVPRMFDPKLPLPEGGLAREEFYVQAALQAKEEAESFGVREARPAGGYNPADYGDGIVESP